MAGTPRNAWHGLSLLLRRGPKPELPGSGPLAFRSVHVSGAQRGVDAYVEYGSERVKELPVRARGFGRLSVVLSRCVAQEVAGKFLSAGALWLLVALGRLTMTSLSLSKMQSSRLNATCLLGSAVGLW